MNKQEIKATVIYSIAALVIITTTAVTMSYKGKSDVANHTEESHVSNSTKNRNIK